MKQTHLSLAKAINGAKSPPQGLPTGIKAAGVCYGVVKSIQLGPPATLTVTLNGSSANVAGLAFMDSYQPVVGDTVLVQQSGADYFILGKAANYLKTKLVCRAHLAGAQSVANGVDPVVVKVDTVDFDPYGHFNTGTWLYTVHVAGYYLCNGGLRFTNITSASNGVHAYIMKNGGTIARGGDGSSGAVGNYPGQNVADRLSCAVNDTIQLGCGQFTGAAENLDNSSVATFLDIKYDGPL